jgi:hypothetical protein
MTEVSKEERAAWLSERSAQALREDVAQRMSSASHDLQSLGLKSTDPNVRAAAERMQTLSELLSKLDPRNA